MEEPEWKKLELSLEQPYKDDEGKLIPILLDITSEGQQVFEPPEDPISKIGENLRRIFLERGVDFFERYHNGIEAAKDEASEEKPKDEAGDVQIQPMTPEELFRMRMDIMPQLHTALGEMSQARDLLSLLLATAPPPQIPGIPQPTAPPQKPSTLNASIVSKPPSIQSVQAFNTQLVIGGKDLALRKAADLLKIAAGSVEKSRSLSERYWLDALKIRRGNWGLIPAPLPFGTATGRGTDKTSKDFLVSFSLEESSVVFRRRAIGRLPTFDSKPGTLEYPLRQYTRLQVSIILTIDGSRRITKNTPRLFDEAQLEESLRAAQAEVVQQEIFAALIREASNLPTASARVSERLIAIEAAQATELRFELVDSENVANEREGTSAQDAVCDLIFATLHVLLLRAHNFIKQHRIGRTNALRNAPPQQQQQPVNPPPLLLPIVELLQYRVFCDRVHVEVGKMADGLAAAGVPVRLRANRVGENGEQLVAMLTKTDGPQTLGGETHLRIDHRHTLRFTYVSPSSLTAHLPQATLTVASITHLTQLLFDEVSRCLLGRICDVGSEMCEVVHGTWFVDLLAGRTVGRWEGRVLTFQVTFAENSGVVCTATKLESSERRPAALVDRYTVAGKAGESLLDWVRRTVDAALSGP
ncbi:uncharacterized protein PHACADRAFT_250784 [Phanerochaete carnosa HHB-10118-sp]|uniref:Mediator of RNA polymerase II transcription subunit 17 n=1 Tax=Phanerochaete carnosa (strain HHB-10118-sp) TaxID=650164 RepID=K5W7P1_PHACS|nr:uncharacterized protein PHACADRAFT_250784 [Phanerochaete carnosa HHB-10118-sp]EKM59963.1 hypothetical protein PHACADRAFT_250784 [Phanerochaete carnosa HHB-10118-sp]